MDTMKHSFLTLFLTAMILLLISAVPVSAESSTITSISPAVGYTGSSTSVTITGTNFNESSVKVKLMMEDETNITSTITSFTSTEIVCKFTISSSRTTGAWDLVVINEDESEVVDTEAFTIRDPMTLSSISPTYAQTNNDSVDFDLEGTGLSDVSDVYLYNEDYDNITASIDDIDSDEITGTFDLTDADEATYDVCVMDSFGTAECDLSFEVTTDSVGSLDISSTPTGASIYVDSEYMGTTPDTLEDLNEGSHKLVLVKAGYSDWGKIVKVVSGSSTTVDADLSAITVATTERTTVATPVPAVATPVPVKTIVRTTTVKVPTPWPTSTTATTTATPASPLEGAVVLGAIGIGIACLHRKY
jgi:hypothetical protein